MEDFAEAWAGTFFGGSWENMGAGTGELDSRNRPSTTRQVYVKSLVATHQLKIDVGIQIYRAFNK